VDQPGYYPIAGGISLRDFIAAAGGLLPGADRKRIKVRQYNLNSENTLVLFQTKTIDYDAVDSTQINLNNFFDVSVPELVNDAAVGSVELTGEAFRPGKYIISRGETLEELLSRAGGLSVDAYPLGASLFREALKKEEKSFNVKLAERIEKTITLTPSLSEDAAGQIQAVLTYTSQLREIPVTGRQSLTSLNDKINLRDGDIIHIPAKPTHVGISGLIQNPISASYKPNKFLEDYINDAGGFDRLADTKNIYVLLPNGSSLTLNSLENHSGLIPAGSQIIVPPKTDKLSALGLTEVISKILGNIATSILAINAVSN
jgi:protein involved in polysaccharide export with SLBB domain